MKKIKLFAYLDEYKMYSISSQIFEGLTEYVLRYAHAENQEREEQKGPVGSGRILADIANKQTGTAEKRFLHDYAYTLFEEELLKEKRVLVIDKDTISHQRPLIEDYVFVKATGKATFNDVRHLTRTVSGFNEMGEALAFVTNYGTVAERSALLEGQLGTARSKAERDSIRKALQSASDPKMLALASGLRHDPIFLEKLAYMLRFGYQDEFVFQTSLEEATSKELLVSAILNRDNLTESEDALIRKYARSTEKEFTLFGVITQSNRIVDLPGDEATPAVDPESGPGALRQAISNMVRLLAGVEDTFTGRLPNEVVVDPIAVYREV
ncbi:MAG: hypothetical protein AB1941_11515 [Gemmatimonadota bacterium]